MTGVVSKCPLCQSGRFFLRGQLFGVHVFRVWFESLAHELHPDCCDLALGLSWRMSPGVDNRVGECVTKWSFMNLYFSWFFFK